MQVDQSTLNNLAENQALIQADGGQVLMTAGAKDALLASVVNNTGVIEARTVANDNGTIIGGTLDASAPNGGNGGFIETSAAQVNVADGTQVTTAAANGLTGSWLIDPVDFTIAASGGNMTGTALSASLGTGNVTIQSSQGTTGTTGDINVNDAVSWSSANTLTLAAQNNVNINSQMDVTGTGNLALQYGLANPASGNTRTDNVNAPVNLASTAHFSTKLGSDGSTVTYLIINSLGAETDATTAPATMTLQGMATSTSLAGNYVLGSDIDAAATNTWNAGTGFVPVGASNISAFTGTLDGLGHTISNLTINRPSTFFVGLFGCASGSTISNIGLLGGSISGSGTVGGLVGDNAYGTINKSYVTGSVSGNNYGVGGLVGVSNSGKISNSYTTGNVNGTGNFGHFVGGLVGVNSAGTVNNSFSTGIVNGASYIGGLIGSNFGGTVSNSYSSGNVSGGSYVGGLVGQNKSGLVSNSYATGNVSGTSSVGGLVGWIDYGRVINSYATGTVSGVTEVGGLVGLVGFDYGGGLISNSYATGSVIGSTSDVGGLVGYNNYGKISNSYAIGNVSGASYVGGLVGLNSNSSNVSNSYAAGNVSGAAGVGGLVGYNNYSTISSSYAMGNVNGSMGDVGGLIGFNNGYNTASNCFWDITTTGQLTSAGGLGMTTGQMQTLSNFTSATSVNGNDNPGWDFSNIWVMYDGYTYPLLRSFMTPLTVTANSFTKTYDRQAYYGVNGVTYSSTPNSNLLGSVSYGGTSQGAIDAGTYSITPSGLYSTQQQGGYAINFISGTLTVDQAVLAVMGTIASNKVYDGTTVATISGGTLIGVISGDALTLTESGTFNSKNVGTGVGVTVTDSLGGKSAGNYTVDQPTGITANITPASLIITANDLYKGYGASDPLLTYNSSGLVIGDTIGSALIGSLIRVSGENIGMYAINQGTLVGNSNYSLSFTPGSLRIVPLVESGQPTTLFTQTGSTLSSTLPRLFAQIDGQQAQRLTKYAINGDLSGEITKQWRFGNGLAVTILDGGVRMPEATDDERNGRQ